MEDDTGKKSQPLSAHALVMQIIDSGQSSEGAASSLLSALSWCVERMLSEEAAEQVRVSYGKVMARHRRVAGMGKRERLEIWSANPKDRGASARVLAYNMDYSIDAAEEKLREAAVAHREPQVPDEKGELTHDASRQRFREAQVEYLKACDRYHDVYLDFPDVPAYRERMYLARMRLAIPASRKREFSALFNYVSIAYLHAFNAVRGRPEDLDAAAGAAEESAVTTSEQNLLKRGIKGTHVSVEPFQLARYLDEQTFRYNNRNNEEIGYPGRFALVLAQIIGKRLTHDELTGKAAQEKQRQVEN